MTIGNALTFIERGVADSDLRARLNAAASALERDKVLSDEKLVFSAHDFDEAFHHRLVQCQTAEEADQIREFKLWWDLLADILEPAECNGRCTGSCCQ